MRGGTLTVVECFQEPGLDDLPQFITFLSEKQNDSAVLAVERRRNVYDRGLDDRPESRVRDGRFLRKAVMSSTNLQPAISIL